MKYFEKIALTPGYLLGRASTAARAMRELMRNPKAGGGIEKLKKYQRQYWLFLDESAKRAK